jgi:hypothetical protein
MLSRACQVCFVPTPEVDRIYSITSSARGSDSGNLEAKAAEPNGFLKVSGQGGTGSNAR